MVDSAAMDIETAREFFSNDRFANCRAEAGYLKALGLAVPPRA